MGAKRIRLVRQLLTESTLLGLLGGLVGLVLAYWSASFIVSMQTPLPFPVAIDLSIDTTVLGFTVALSIVTGLLFGLVPALRASRPDLVPTLKDETVGLGGRRRRFSARNVLVVSQVAISLVLLVAAGLFVRGLTQAQHVDPGFGARNGAMTTLDLSVAGYTDGHGTEFYRTLMRRIRSLPGVEAVTMADRLPLGLGLQTQEVHIPGYELPADQRELEVDFARVGPGYFDAMQIPLLYGRSFRETDAGDASRVAIVSAAMAQRFWGTENVVGRHLYFGDGTDGTEVQIVGVARDTKVRTLGEAPRPYLYEAHAQGNDPLFTSIMARSSGDAIALVESIRREIRALDGSVPIFEAKTLEEHLGVALFAPTMGALLLSAFGVLAMLLAAIGLYGVVAQSVAQRTREVGIRVALGAREGQVVGMVLREGMGVVAVGVGVGLALSLFAMQPLAGMLHGVSATDPITFAGVAALLGAVALVASYVPARRAAKTDPMKALRYE